MYTERIENVILASIFLMYGCALTYLFYLTYIDEPGHIYALIFLLGAISCFVFASVFIMSTMVAKPKSPKTPFLTETRLILIIALFLFVLAFIFVKPTNNEIFDSIPNLFLMILATFLIIVAILWRRPKRCKSIYSEKDWDYCIRCQQLQGHSGKHTSKSILLGTTIWGDPNICKHLLGEFCHNPQFKVERCKFFETQELCSCYEEVQNVASN